MLAKDPQVAWLCYSLLWRKWNIILVGRIRRRVRSQSIQELSQARRVGVDAGKQLVQFRGVRSRHGRYRIERSQDLVGLGIVQVDNQNRDFRGLVDILPQVAVDQLEAGLGPPGYRGAGPPDFPQDRLQRVLLGLGMNSPILRVGPQVARTVPLQADYPVAIGFWW